MTKSRMTTNLSHGEYVVLVNTQNETLGVEEKIKAHKKGLLHRAFSVFILNSHNELLLQQRAPTKYHSSGLWSNTCCGHPRPEEPVVTGARRRLMTEMGLDCTLEEIGSFVYRAEIDHRLVENEYDHVLIGYSDEQPTINPEEAVDWKWMSFAMLEKELRQRPEDYTFWFNIIIGSHIQSFIPPIKWHWSDGESTRL